MKKLTLGSLFDGSGGFPLAGLLNGIEPVWASEIEPFPIRVTTKRLPQMKHYGDVSKINGGDIEPVDIITFGSPCQDLSVAGKRHGLDGDRSSLFFQAIRIIREMRLKTNGVYPTVVVWENVRGAFSSNGGADFRQVLQSLAEIGGETAAIPQPKRWQPAGCIVGRNNGYAVAWRMLDAQFWGVPQRRQRVFVVATFADDSAGRILFSEPESLPWHSEEVRRPWKRFATDPEGSVGMAGDIHAVTLQIRSGCEGGGKGALIQDDKSATLSCGNVQTLFQPAIGIARDAFNAGQNAQFSPTFGDDVQPTINAAGASAVCHAYPVQFNPTDSRIKLETETNVCQTLVSRMGTGGNQVPLVMQTAYTIDSTDYKDPPVVGHQYGAKYIVRRLYPIECCRLQGFPDYWTRDLYTHEPTEEDLVFWREVFETHRRLTAPNKKPKTDKQIIKWLKDPYSDSAEYKMWGNGVALPCVDFIMSQIVRFWEG